MIANSIQPFYALEILAKAQALQAQGREILHLEIGEPGGMTAPAVLAAVKSHIDRPLGYTSAKGDPALRLRLAQYYKQHHNIDVNPDNIMITMGSSAGFILTFLAGFERGDRIAVTRPGYPAYLNILASLGMGVTEIELSVEDNWKPTVASIEAAYAEKPFKGFLLASPANPTGSTLSREELSEIIACCDRLGVRFISDEIYHGLNYTGDDISCLEVSDKHVIVNSFSKYYCMTGWRIGWLVLPDDIIRRAEVMAQSLFISASSVSQKAAIAALDEREYFEKQKAVYANNRLRLTKGLRDIGFANVIDPDGAFYSYVDVTPFGRSAMDICMGLLDDASVAATPGDDFDRTHGSRYMRFSYAGTQETIDVALERIGNYLK